MVDGGWWMVDCGLWIVNGEIVPSKQHGSAMWESEKPKSAEATVVDCFGWIG
jgi:hypothetical protein